MWRLGVPQAPLSGAAECLIQSRGIPRLHRVAEPAPEVRSCGERERWRNLMSPTRPFQDASNLMCSVRAKRSPRGCRRAPPIHLPRLSTSHPYSLPGRWGPRNSMVGNARRWALLSLRAALKTPYPRLRRTRQYVAGGQESVRHCAELAASPLQYLYALLVLTRRRCVVLACVHKQNVYRVPTTQRLLTAGLVAPAYTFSSPVRR